MPEPNEQDIDHVQQKLNKIFETRYDTDRVNIYYQIPIFTSSNFFFRFLGNRG